ncbi:uncharacterized protein PpBr36_06750 [Pyricularia pennisetigena]|uniref:uncharacterized protein n=1 Tax=Pyricularia pennisetigena TaxID=1578925 RepID=UPI0011522A86|nr:uncharacterized protein PpBr36_06750 [Pyricularia pennisetigena]TLS23061.1 hypothetical protein PpBr36_06750 [Pyricularia pennisetigena]
MLVNFVISCIAVGAAAMPTGKPLQDGDISAAQASSLSHSDGPSHIVARSPALWDKVRSKKKKQDLRNLRPKERRPPKNVNWDGEIVVETPGTAPSIARPIRPDVPISQVMAPAQRPAAASSPPRPQQEWVPHPSYAPEDPDTWENDVPPSQQAIQAVED